MSKTENETSKPSGNFLFVLYLFVEVVFVLVTSLPFLLLTLVRNLIGKPGKNIAGKTVLVTGSARGLGRALSIEFARRGCKLICVDVNKSLNEKTAQEIDEIIGKPKTASSLSCDVSNFQSVLELAEEVSRQHGKIDILVNNAGIICGKEKSDETDEAMTRKVVDVNLLSSYWLVRAFLPQMKESNEGHIVFVNSISSLIPLGDATIYTATKYGLLGLTEALMDEFSRSTNCKNIKISSVHPFFVRTEGLKNLDMTPKHLTMTPETAAKFVVAGVRRGYKKFTVPGNELVFWILSLSRVVPHKTYQTLINRIHGKVLT